MRITIFNASDRQDGPAIDQKVELLKEELGSTHTVQMVTLRDLNLKYCTGCWDCWVKTPGKCKIKDDIDIVHQAFMDAELVVFASPVKMGFPSALMKKVNDRLVPLVHPYIELVQGECHHRKRYKEYPLWGLLLQQEVQGSKADVQLIHEIYARTALNIKSTLKFTLTTEKTVKEIAHEIDHL